MGLKRKSKIKFKEHVSPIVCVAYQPRRERIMGVVWDFKGKQKGNKKVQEGKKDGSREK